MPVGSDKVEQVAMLARGGVGPLARGALAGLGTAQADIEAAPGRVLDVAHEPVAALSPPVGQVVAAQRLGIARETVGQVGGCAVHGVRPPH